MRISEESLLKLEKFAKNEGSEMGEVLHSLLHLYSLSDYITERLYNHIVDELKEILDYIDNNVIYINDEYTISYERAITRDEVDDITWEKLQKQKV